ncbi:MAG: diguanylate cyclase, partial [Rhodospirillaceae bacterium]
SEIIGVKVTLIPTRTFEETLKFAKARRCDLIPLAAETPERKQFLDFSHPYLTFPIVISTRLSQPYIADLQLFMNEPIGAVKSTVFINALRTRYPKANVIDFDDNLEGLRQVQDGKLFGFVSALPIISYLTQSAGLIDLKVAGQLEDKFELTIATRNDEPLLHEIFQAAIDAWSPQRRQEIVNHWLSVRVEQGFDYVLMWKIVGAAAGIIGGGVLWIRQLARWNREITEKNVQLAEANAIVLAMARTDGLTGIANRRWFDESLAQELARAIRSQTSIGLLLIDIDCFKLFNDNYGHSAGDDCLRIVAQALQGIVKRPPDLVARYGGEEIVCILPGTDSTGVEAVGNDILDAVRALAIPHALSKASDIVTVSSGGISIIPKAGMTPRQVIKAVDAMLYVSKEAGRNRLTMGEEEL